MDELHNALIDIGAGLDRTPWKWNGFGYW
jgi:hypothetical protein